MTTEQLTIKYILLDMPTAREDVVTLIIEILQRLTMYPNIFNQQLQKLAFLKAIELFQLYKLNYGNHKNLELAFYRINLVLLQNEQLLKAVL